MKTFTEHMQQLIERRNRGELRGIMQYTGKLEGRALAEELGIAVPRLVAGPFDLEEWPADPETHVTIKPVSACTARGVFPLYRVADRYVSLWADHDDSVWGAAWEFWRERSWQEHQIRVGRPAEYEPRWYLEELLLAPPETGGGVAYDWKCYVIGGEVAFVRQHQKTGRHPHDCRVRCWFRNWVPVEGDMLVQRKQVDEELPAPRHGREIIEAAERIGQELQERTGSPFVRVDLFENEEGPVFCELTPHPAGGKQRYREGWDRMLGAMWSEKVA